MSKPPQPEGADPILRPYRLAFVRSGPGFGGLVSRRSYAHRGEWEKRVSNLRRLGLLIEEETFDATEAAPARMAGPADSHP